MGNIISRCLGKSDTGLLHMQIIVTAAAPIIHPADKVSHVSIFKKGTTLQRRIIGKSIGTTATDMGDGDQHSLKKGIQHELVIISMYIGIIKYL